MKKYIVGIILVFIIVAGGAFYIYNQPLKRTQISGVFSKNGVSFSYPKNLELVGGGDASGSYGNYSIINSLADPLRGSGIIISIPLDNKAESLSLPEEARQIAGLKGFSLEKNVTKINVNGHDGEMIVYTAFNTEDPRPIHATHIIQQFKTKYPSSRIQFEYIKIDLSLDQAWETIQQTLDIRL